MSDRRELEVIMGDMVKDLVEVLMGNLVAENIMISITRPLGTL